MKNWNFADNWGDDYIDSRDIIARYEELSSEKESLEWDLENAEDDDEKQSCQEALDEWEDENDHEFTNLKSIIEQGEDSPDWSYGEGLIRDQFFTEYAEELARDCGYINDKTDRWPYTCINWEEAASQLQQDYFEIEANNEIYWIRA